MFSGKVVKFQRIEGFTDLQLPAYASYGAAGMDIRAAHAVLVRPGNMMPVKTGFNIEIPEGFEIQVRPRSGLAFNHGVTIANSPGTIDSDYRGEIIVMLVNHGKNLFHVKKGDRIAQLVLAPVCRATVQEVEQLSETVRGTGGFGSTGVA